MSLDSSPRPSRGGPRQDLWPKWMWVAVPVLVVVVVAGLWWAIFSPPDTSLPTPSPTATMRLIRTQPTQEPTKFQTLPAGEATSTRQVLDVSTFTPTPPSIVTPAGGATAEAEGLGIGAEVKVDASAGLNMRAGAGTGHARIKTLANGTLLEVIGGPKDANGFTWWQVRDPAGATGWVVSKYLMQQ